MLAGVRVGRQLRTLARLEDTEDDGADEGSYELRYCLVDCTSVSEKLHPYRDFTDDSEMWERRRGKPPAKM